MSSSQMLGSWQFEMQRVFRMATRLLQRTSHDDCKTMMALIETHRWRPKKKKRTEQKITLHQWSPRREIGKLTGKPDRGKLSNPRIQTSFPCVKRSTVGDSQSSNRAVEKKSSRLHYDKKIVANNRVDARETRGGERNCPGIRKVVRNEEERKSRRRKRRRRMRD